jgi:hypothetical protein
MSLEKMNLAELNAQEVREIEGGWPPFAYWLLNIGMPTADVLTGDPRSL